MSAIGDFSPDVVLMDIGMPHMNGYEAAKLIRSHPQGSRIKLVAITGWGQDADKQKAREVGFDEHVTKSIDSTSLMRILS